MSFRMPLDSVAVIPRRSGAATADRWSEMTAERITARLAFASRLRVVPYERVRSRETDPETTPEEIGRAFNVTAIVVCSVTAAPPSLDLDLEIIDVLGESLIARLRFLSSTASARRLYAEAARMVVRSMADPPRRR